MTVNFYCIKVDKAKRLLDEITTKTGITHPHSAILRPNFPENDLHITYVAEHHIGGVHLRINLYNYKHHITSEAFLLDFQRYIAWEC